jgi:hypothetical protein
MTTVHITQGTAVPLNRLVAALIDFGPGRGKIFGNGHEQWVWVNVCGDTWTDVTEGSSGGLWERLRCDWSDLSVVRLTTVDSNIWRPGSGWVYSLSSRSDGGTDIDLVVVRKGCSIRGRFSAALMAVAGKPVLGRDLRRSLRAIEQSRPQGPRRVRSARAERRRDRRTGPEIRPVPSAKRSIS